MNRSRTILAAVGAAVVAVCGSYAPTQAASAVEPSRVASESSVSIQGPSSVKPNTRCAFWGVAGGQAPYTWSWSGGLSGTAYGDEYHTNSPTSGGFLVEVTVTDGLGNTSTASKSVTVSRYAPDCVI